METESYNSLGSNATPVHDELLRAKILFLPGILPQFSAQNLSLFTSYDTIASMVSLEYTPLYKKDTKKIKTVQRRLLAKSTNILRDSICTGLVWYSKGQK